jgi:sugar/nucleoside kinase (ribokinase family)
MYDICCVGHITLDKVVTTKATFHMPGGTAIYFSSAIRNMPLKYSLVTSLAGKEMDIVAGLREKGIEITVLPSNHTVYFENIYAENQDHRTQRVTQKADPFLQGVWNEMEATIYHLGPLLADDIPVSLIKMLAAKARVSLDVQGYLREVRNENVYPIDWADKLEALRYIDILKANEHEMEVLTGSSDVYTAARILNEWGVKEVVITLGSMGSVIYKEAVFYHIPAYKPIAIVDATGCGDTYMAGYLYQRINGANIQEAGEFAAAMATLKIESSGPFTGNRQDVEEVLRTHAVG